MKLVDFVVDFVKPPTSLLNKETGLDTASCWRPNTWYYNTDFHLASIFVSSIALTVASTFLFQMDHVKQIWYLSPMRAAKVQASLRIRAVSPEPSLLARTISESRGTVRQKARSLAPLNVWACAVEICHNAMLEDTNSLDGAQMVLYLDVGFIIWLFFFGCWKYNTRTNLSA